MQTLGQRAKALRKTHRLTQIQLSERLGITHAAVSSIENGSNPSEETIDGYIKTFDCSREWLINGTGPAPDGLISVGSKAANIDNPWKDELYIEMKQQIEFYKEIIRNLTKGKEPNFLKALNSARATGKIVEMLIPEAQLGAQRA